MIIIEFIPSYQHWHEEVVNAEACRRWREKDPFEILQGINFPNSIFSFLNDHPVVKEFF